MKRYLIAAGLCLLAIAQIPKPSGSGGGGGGGGTSNTTTYGTYASLPGSCTTGDQYWTSDSVYNFVCTATNTWTPFYRGKRVYIPPTSWTTVNTGGETFDTTYGYAYLSAPANSGDSLRARVRSVTAPYKVTALIQVLMNTTNFGACGLTARDSSGGGLVTHGAHTPFRFYSYYHASATSSGSGRGTEFVWDAAALTDLWLQIEDDNTNRVLRWSITGDNWVQYSSSARTTDITANQVGLFCNSNNSQPFYMRVLSYREE